MTKDTGFRVVAPDADWPPPVEMINADSSSPILLLCEHASNHIPSEYNGLGLGAEARAAHIAWDIGAADVTRRLAARLDACAMLGTYSRLLVDLNRPLDVASAMPQRSEVHDIPGNAALTPAERARRALAIFNPYHEAIAAYLDARGDQPTLIVSIHSFTPVYADVPRPWNAGILFGAAEGLGMRLVARLASDPARCIGINQPYSVSREEDYALPVHGDARGIDAVLVEIRNDELATADGRQGWAELLCEVLMPEIERLAPEIASR